MIENRQESEPTNPETPLQGWKEISAYLERDERTARRWETEEGLPVRRYRTDRRSSVYAYPSEIEEWRLGKPLPSASADPEEYRSKRLPLWLAVGAIAAGFAFLLLLRSPRLDPITEAASPDNGIRTTELRRGGSVGMVSQDGRYLSETDWVNSGDIGIRDLTTGEYHRLGDKPKWGTELGEADRSIFSPDGKKIAYAWLHSRDGQPAYELRVIDAFEQVRTPKTVYFNPELSHIQPEAWSRDDRFLVTFRNKDWSAGLGFASMGNDADIQIIKTLPESPSGAFLSHDERWIAYSAPSSPQQSSGDIYLIAADGSRETTVARSEADDLVMGFAPGDKSLLFVSNRTGNYDLWAQKLLDGRPKGEPQMLVRDFGRAQSLGVLADGALAYVRALGSVDIFSVELNFETGKLLSSPRKVPTQLQGSSNGPWLSPDGKRLAYFAPPGAFGDSQANRYLWIRDNESGKEDRVPMTDLDRHGLVVRTYSGLAWSPEGKRLLATAEDSRGGWNLCEIDAESGNTKILTTTGPMESRPRPVGWKADGATAIYRQDRGIYGVRDGKVEELYGAQGRSRAFKILETSISNRHHLIAWREWDGEPEYVKVMSTEGGEAKIAFENRSGPTTGYNTGWAADGNSLLVTRNLKGDRLHTGVWIVPLDGRDAFESELRGATLDHMNVLPDGKTVMYQAGSADPRVFRIENYLPADDAEARP